MKQFTVVHNAAKKQAEILIYGPIGKSFWDDSGITAKEFTNALDDLPKGTAITIGINSQGGAIGEGLAIYNAIARRKEDITARIDGYALSAGSFIPLAASKVVSPESAIWMIHRGWSFAQGNADEMRKAADLLDVHDETLVSIYEKRTGKNRKEIQDALADETWLSGTEAVAWGLADETGGDVDNDAMDAVDLAAAPQGAFKRSPVVAMKRIYERILAGSTSTRSHKGAECSTTADVQPAINLQTAGTVPVAACNQERKESNMDTAEKTAQAATDKPAHDQNADLVSAINKLNDRIDALVKPAEASAPVAPRIENLGNPLVEKYNDPILDKVQRASLAKNHYFDLRNQLLIANGVRNMPAKFDRFDFNDRMVMNANTVDSALANTILSGEFVTTMRTYIGPWNAFSRRVSLSPLSRRQTLEVPLYSSAGSKQQNATNYESGDSVLAPIAVSVAEESKSFHVSRPEANLGLELAGLVPTNAAVLAEGIHAKMTALMVSGNYGAATAIGTAANFDSADLRAILALGKNYNRVTLLLDGGHLAYLLPTTRESFAFGEPGAYGFDGGIYKNNLWTSAETNCVGFVCGPDAIANGWGVADGLPAGEAISQSTVDVNGIPFGLSVWFSRGSRAVWASFQVMHGCAAGDKTQAEVLVTS